MQQDVRLNLETPSVVNKSRAPGHTDWIASGARRLREEAWKMPSAESGIIHTPPHKVQSDLAK